MPWFSSRYGSFDSFRFLQRKQAAKENKEEIQTAILV